MFDFIKKFAVKPKQDNTRQSSGVLKGELTPIINKLFTNYFKYMDNPDKIVIKKSNGKTLSELYDTMIDSDPHLASVINTRKLALMGLKYRIEPFIDTLNGATEATRKDKQIAANVAWAISQIKKLRNSIQSSLSSMEHGYSVSEIIWDFMNDMYVPGRIKHRKPEYFKFGADDELYYVANYNGEQLMPRDKFLVLTFNEKYADPYGNALCKSAYWPCWFKTTLIKFMLTFSEKLGQPTIQGIYPNTWNQDQKDEFLTQLTAVQNNSCLIRPEDTTVELLESAARKEADFITALEFFNAEISKIVLGQTLTTEQGKTGSYSLGQVHNDVREDILVADAEWLSDGYTDNLCGPITVANYGPDANWPLMKFIVPKKKDLLSDSTIVDKAIDSGLEVGETYYREHFEIPEPQPGEKILKKAQIQVPAFPQDNTPQFSDKHRHSRKAKFAYKTQIPPGAKSYDKAIYASYYDKLYEFMMEIFGKVEDDLLRNLSPTTPIAGLIDQSVRNYLNRGEFKSELARSASDAAYSIAANIAKKFNAPLSSQVYYDMANKYMVERFYQKGTVEGIASTFRDLLSGAIQNWDDPNIMYDFGKMKSMIQDAFEGLSPFKADQIAKNEIREAANFASFETIDRAGLSNLMEAYFITDPDSCDICQEWASNNPYDMGEAKSMGLPHINCNDQWSFVIKESGDENDG